MVSIVSKKPRCVFIELIKPIRRIYILLRAFTEFGLHRVVVHVVHFLARHLAVVHRSGVSPALPEMIVPVFLCADVVIQFFRVVFNQSEFDLLCRKL